MLFLLDYGNDVKLTFTYCHIDIVKVFPARGSWQDVVSALAIIEQVKHDKHTQLVLTTASTSCLLISLFFALLTVQLKSYLVASVEDIAFTPALPDGRTMLWSTVVSHLHLCVGWVAVRRPPITFLRMVIRSDVHSVVIAYHYYSGYDALVIRIRHLYSHMIQSSLDSSET